MREKQSHLQASRKAVREILRVTQRTQGEFAGDIGAKPGEVRQWTSVRAVPEEYRRRIAAATGAEWDESGTVWQTGSKRRRKFTRKSFDGWRDNLIAIHKGRLGFPTNPYNVIRPNGERDDRYNIEDFLNGRVRDIIGRTMAAAEDRRGENNYRRLFAVLESLIHWSQGILDDFKLSDSKHIQDVHQRATKNGIIESDGRLKYIPLMRSITDTPKPGVYWKFKTNKNGGNVVFENGKRAVEIVSHGVH